MLITVVRHLEPVPVSSVADPITDIDRPLSDAGVEAGESLLANVRAAAEEYGRLPWGNAYGTGYTSPYVRCRQTATLIATAVSPEWRWHEVPELRESAHAPQVSRLRRKLLVNEESTFELRDRVARFMSLVHGATYPVLVVTHGDVVNAFRWVIEGMTFAQYREMYDDPDNFVPFGAAWSFNTDTRVAERRVLGDTSPDKVVEMNNRFAHGADSYRLTLAEAGLSQ